MTIQELADRAEVTTRTIRYYVEQGVLPPPGYGRPAEYTYEHVQRLALIKRLKEQYLPLDEIRDTLQRLTLDEVGQLLSEPSYAPQQVAQQQKLDSASEYLNNVLGRGMVREQMKKRMPPAQAEIEDMDEASSFVRKPEAPGSGFALQETPDTYADLERMPTPPVPPASAPAPASMAAPGAPPPAPSRKRAADERSRPEGAATRGGQPKYIQPPATESETEQSVEIERLSTTWERVNLGDGVELHFPTGADASVGGKVARLIEAARRILGKNPGNGE
ncbi:MAG: MerR family transcriptional regulator [Chloroflexia bacterium]